MKDAHGLSAMYWMVRRELKLTMRRKSDAMTPLLFFVIVTSLFPLSVGTDVEMLRRIAPGVLWVTALLATMLSLSRLFEQDYADGSLEQLALSPAPLSAMVVGKVVAYWLMTGLPLALLAPLDRKSTRLNSSHVAISYAVFCLKKKKLGIQPCYSGLQVTRHRYLTVSHGSISYNGCGMRLRSLFIRRFSCA